MTLSISRLQAMHSNRFATAASSSPRFGKQSSSIAELKTGGVEKFISACQPLHSLANLILMPDQVIKDGDSHWIKNIQTATGESVDIGFTPEGLVVKLPLFSLSFTAFSLPIDVLRTVSRLDCFCQVGNEPAQDLESLFPSLDTDTKAARQVENILGSLSLIYNCIGEQLGDLGLIPVEVFKPVATQQTIRRASSLASYLPLVT